VILDDYVRSVQNGILLGRLAGIPIRLRWSFLLLLGLVFLWMGGLSGVFIVALTFASVLVHELGHALVARRLDVRIAGIDLHFLGGAAMMVDPPRSARDEMLIAAAGPLVSLALAGLGLGLGAATGLGLVTILGWVNLILGIFNLIPALPMDGGRILRAALARRLEYGRATDVAVTVSRVFVLLFAIGGLVSGQLQLALLAGLLWMLGSAERRNAWATAYRDRAPRIDVLPPTWGPRSSPFRAPRTVVVSRG
jgi:Zn-dependent protease